MVTFCKVLAGIIMAIAAFVAGLNLLDFLKFVGRTVDGAAAIAASSGNTVAQAVIILLLATIVFLLADSKTLFPSPAKEPDALSVIKERLTQKLAAPAKS